MSKSVLSYGRQFLHPAGLLYYEASYHASAAYPSLEREHHQLLYQFCRSLLHSC